MLGKMFPFTSLAFVNLQNNLQSATYQPGFTPVYIKDVKYPEDGSGPLRLVYASPGYLEEKNGPMIGVFVYEVNKNYTPESETVMTDIPQ